MIITRVRWAPYRIPFRTPYVTSRGAVGLREGLVLELTTDDGHTGLGEAAPDPSLQVPAAALASKLADFAGHLLGADLEELAVSVAAEQGAHDATECALACAIDTASIDALAHAESISAALQINAEARATVAVNALVTAADPVVAQDEAAVARRAGFRTVKLKVGFLPSLEAERERVAAVREAIGPFVRMRIDPNGAWHEAQAIAAIRAFEALDIEYVEQPIPPGDFAALGRVQAAVDTPVAADEDLTDLGAAQALIAARAVRVLVMKPQRLGGLAVCADIARSAEAAGIRCVVTTSIETGIGTAACLHLAAAMPGQSLAHGLATGSLLAAEIATPELLIEDGVMELPGSPGLGVGLGTTDGTKHLGDWQEAGE